MILSKILPLRKTGRKQISKTRRVSEGGESYGGKAGDGSGSVGGSEVLRGLLGGPSP